MLFTNGLSRFEQKNHKQEGKNRWHSIFYDFTRLPVGFFVCCILYRDSFIMNEGIP